MKPSSPNPAAVAAILAAAAVVFLSALSAPSSAATLLVGPDKFYKTVRAAAEAAQSGDLVLIDAGVYSKDVARWKADNVTVRGVGGRAHLRADGAEVGGKGIWIVSGKNFTAENIEFSGAAVPDRNGAGIRSETEGTLVLRNCYFHGNENGILGGADSMLIESCVFDRNGAGDGRTHNLYVWGRSVAIRGSYTHRAVVGHNIKTRATTNYILYNRISDESDGTASYEIDVPDCGRTYIIGNLIEQGPRSENSSIVAYGAESDNNVMDLDVVNNTIMNRREDGATYLQLREGAKALIQNNILYGPGTAWSGGRVIEANNYIETLTTNAPRFFAPGAYDFHLTRRSPKSLVDAGSPPGTSATGFDLTPTSEYVHEARCKPRPSAGALDIGAYELGPKLP